MKNLLLLLIFVGPCASGQTVQPLLQPRQTFFTSTGLPCSLCLLYTYRAGTTTPLATYTDSSGTTQNPNPVPLDSSASASVWTGNNSYKLVLKTSSGVTVWTEDNVSGTISLTGNITQAQVTGLPTSLAGKVDTTRTVNGHALSADVTLSASDLTTGTLPHGQLPALVGGDIPNNAANTSGNSGTSTALSTIGSGGTFWGVSGGAQGWFTPAGGGNVSNSGTPSAGQFAQWTGPTAVQGIAATGSGSVVLATSPTFGTGITVSGCAAGSYVKGDNSGCGTPSGTLPAASSNRQYMIVDTSNAAHIITEGNSYVDAVNGRLIDNTGVTQVGVSLTSIVTALPSSNPPPIILGPGIYNVKDGFNIPCSSSVCSGLVIRGAGRWATTIQSDCSGSAKDVLRLAKSTSGNIFTGVTIEHLTIKDTSGTGACRSLLDISNQAGFTVSDVAVTGAKGKIYSTGTVSITNGATALTGSGTSWATEMCPGLVQIGGFDQECAVVNSSTSITMSSNWQATTATGAAYALDYYGNGVMLEHGANSGDYTQYGTLRDVYSTGNRVCIYAAGTSTGGVSGITITGQNSQCEVRGSRTTDSVGHFWGKHTDTIRDETPINNVAFGVILESAHANWISSRIENDSSVTPVTTCSGGVATQACTIGIQLAADAGSTGYGNVLDAPYIYLFGDGIKTVGTNADSALQILGLRGPVSFSANIHNYNFNGVTSWGGLPCPSTGSGVHAVILTYDCNHVTVAQTVN